MKPDELKDALGKLQAGKVIGNEGLIWTEYKKLYEGVLEHEIK